MAGISEITAAGLYGGTRQLMFLVSSPWVFENWMVAGGRPWCANSPKLHVVAEVVTHIVECDLNASNQQLQIHPLQWQNHFREHIRVILFELSINKAVETATAQHLITAPVL
jgi:hypothetical protein